MDGCFNPLAPISLDLNSGGSLDLVSNLVQQLPMAMVLLPWGQDQPLASQQWLDQQGPPPACAIFLQGLLQHTTLPELVIPILEQLCQFASGQDEVQPSFTRMQWVGVDTQGRECTWTIQPWLGGAVQGCMVIVAVSQQDLSSALAEEVKLRQIMEAGTDLIWASNLSGELTYISVAFEHLLHRRVEDWLGKSFMLLTHPDDIAGMQSIINQALSSGKPQQGFEVRASRADGVWVPMTSNFGLMTSPEGDVIGFQGILRDIRDRKQIEAALQQQQDQYRSMFDSLSVGIAIGELEQGYLVNANPACSQIYGMTHEEHLATHPSELLLPHELPKFADYIDRLSQGQSFTTECQARHSDGRVLDLEVRVVPYHYNGKLHALSILDDVSDRKAAERERQASAARIRQQATELENALAELRRTQTHLVQSEKMSGLGQLVAGVAHEINNPTNFIYGNIRHADTYTHDLLELIHLYQTHYPEPVPEIVERIEDLDLEFLQEDLPKTLASMRVGAERIQGIVAALRTFSRMDESEVKAVNLHDGLDSTLMILQHRIKSGAGQENLAVIKQYQTLPELTCYAGQLNQVFMNILSNAIDAIEDYNEQRAPEAIAAQPCEIHISTALIDNWVEIRIRDNGPGIPEEVQSRLFDPFFTTKPVGKGTGMGLAISYQVVVDKHGGLLMCESAPGRGTEFIIELPLNCETQTGSRDPILKR